MWNHSLLFVADLEPAIQRMGVRRARFIGAHWMGGSEAAHGEKGLIPPKQNLL
jgi:hypothetical protein